MKYVITESQYKLISELERTWRDMEYAEQYEKVRHKLIPLFRKIFDTEYGESEASIKLYGSDGKILIMYSKFSGELFYDRSLDETYEKIFPHPFWYRHGSYLLSDVFESLFPEYQVKSVQSAHIS